MITAKDGDSFALSHKRVAWTSSGLLEYPLLGGAAWGDNNAGSPAIWAARGGLHELSIMSESLLGLA